MLIGVVINKGWCPCPEKTEYVANRLLAPETVTVTPHRSLCRWTDVRALIVGLRLKTKR